MDLEHWTKEKKEVEKVEKVEQIPGMEEIVKKLGELKEIIKGKVVVLFGAPLVGKSILVHLISRHFENPILFKIDTNYQNEYKSLNPKLKYISIASPKQLLFYLRKLSVNSETLLILDSLTTMASDILGERIYTSPKAFNEVAQFYDIVINSLGKFRNIATSIVTTHEKIIDFSTGEIGPRMNLVTLRNADIVLRLSVENNIRKLTSWKMREKPKKIEDIVIEI
ncbi:MAG TPA: hypothetical protein ENF99_00920 [Candidatus Aenigmarchaeota archaeon]|nr:hypothetical protein [Candidatus Aenigmarchaeota archaeon]